MALTVLSQTGILSLMILLGYILRKAGYFKAAHADFMTKLVLDIFFPASVFVSASNDFGGDGGIGRALTVMAVWFVFLLVFFGISYAVASLLPLSRDERLVFANSVGYPNNGFMGLPLCIAVFGAKGGLWMSLTIPGTTLYIFAVLTMTLQRTEEDGHPLSLKSLATPLNICIPIMLVMIVAGFKISGPLYSACDALGACVTPVAMLLIGDILAANPILDALGRPPVYVVTLLRNIIMPLLVAFLLRFTPWDREMCLCLVLIAGCSVAASVSIFATRYGRASAFAGQCMLQSTLLLPVTMPVVMLFAERILM